MTSPSEPPIARPSSFDEWLQAFKEQATFFTGLKLDKIDLNELKEAFAAQGLAVLRLLGL